MAPATPALMRTHRFALSISGGIALGSYEAGVLAQLYRDLTSFNAHADILGKARVSIDAIAGASAGSITGLILAQALSLGSSPDELESRLKACWVDLLSIENLLKPSPDDPKQSLFSDGIVADVVKSGVNLTPNPPTEPQEAVALWITMTNLDGIPFVIDFKSADKQHHHAQTTTELYALDYRDYVPFLLTGSDIETLDNRMMAKSAEGGSPSTADIWQAAAEAARASSAFPIAFPSQYQQRDLTCYEEYNKFKKKVEQRDLPRASGQPGLQAKSPLPTDAYFQFVDGGLFHNEPIGKCIDAVEELNRRFPERNPYSAESQGQSGRSFVVIEPEPQLPEQVEISLAQSTPHPDHPALPPAVLAKILSAYFNTALYSDFQNAATMNHQIADLDAALGKLDTLGLDASQAGTLEEIKKAIRKAVGLEGKNLITLQRIPAEVPPSRHLAGAFGGHFGGFLRRDFREADFITGRYEARQWLGQWLAQWLGDHASDIDKALSDITPEYALSLLGEAPPDPAAHALPPTGLTPEQLAHSGWSIQPDEAGNVTETERLAALTSEEREAIVKLAEARGLTLLETWLHINSLAGFAIKAALSHWLNPHLIDDPKS